MHTHEHTHTHTHTHTHMLNNNRGKKSLFCSFPPPPSQYIEARARCTAEDSDREHKKAAEWFVGQVDDMLKTKAAVLLATCSVSSKGNRRVSRLGQFEEHLLLWTFKHREMFKECIHIVVSVLSIDGIDR